MDQSTETGSRTGPIWRRSIFRVPKEAFLRRWAWRMVKLGPPGLLLFLLLVWTFVNCLGSWSLHREIKKLKVLGVPMEAKLADTRPRTRPGNAPPSWREEHDDADNAARLYRAASLIIVPPDEEDAPLLPTYVGRDAQAPPPLGVQLPPENLEACLRHLERNRQALLVLDEARRLPECRFMVDWSDPSSILYHLSDLRRCSDLLLVNGYVAVAEGDFEQAVHEYRASFLAGRRLCLEPAAMSQIIRLNLCEKALRNGLERTLGLGAIPIGLIEEVAGEIEQENSEFDMSRSAFFQAAMLIEGVEQLRGGLKGYDWVWGQYYNRCGFLFYVKSGLFKLDAAKAMREHRRIIENLDLPLFERYQAMLGAERELSQDLGAWGHIHILRWTIRLRPILGPWNKFRYPLTSSLPSQMVYNVRRELDYHALLGATQTALAFEMFRLKEGSFPDEAEQAFEDGTKVPIDPYTGDHFKIAHTESGLTFYSLGRNGEDDGGAVLRDEVGEYKDIGFRLLAPGKQGQTEVGNVVRP